jgi:hypothetical protein
VDIAPRVPSTERGRGVVKFVVREIVRDADTDTDALAQREPRAEADERVRHTELAGGIEVGIELLLDACAEEKHRPCGADRLIGGCGRQGKHIDRLDLRVRRVHLVVVHYRHVIGRDRLQCPGGRAHHQQQHSRAKYCGTKTSHRMFLSSYVRPQTPPQGCWLD